MPRKPSCTCDECPKCRNRIANRKRYQAMSKDERRALVERRDIEKARAADRARYERDKPKRRALADEYAKQNPERMAAAKKGWIERNPEKHAAHIAVGNAVRDGKLVKGSCERAGEGGCTERIQAHHDDYEKVLEVRWLCSAHHALTHRETRA